MFRHFMDKFQIQMAIKRQTKLNFILNALNFLADKQTLVVMVGHGFFPVVYKKIYLVGSQNKFSMILILFSHATHLPLLHFQILWYCCLVESDPITITALRKKRLNFHASQRMFGLRWQERIKLTLSSGIFGVV